MRPRAIFEPVSRSAAVVGLTAALACSSSPSIEELRSILETAEDVPPQEIDHRGPDVAMGAGGPGRYVDTLFQAFSTDRAMETVRFADQYYRAPASPGFDDVLDRIIAALGEAGYGQDPRLELRILERPMEAPAWSPVRASLTLLTQGMETPLHAFGPGKDRERTMLPVNSPSADVRGNVALSLSELDPGEILVTEASARQVLTRARDRGAAAVVSASLFPFNIDPTGADRHLDAIQFREMPAETAVPVCQISPRSFERISAAMEKDPSTALHLVAEVKTEERPLRTVVAAVVGATHPDEAIAMSSHVQEPGACDNASGLAGLLESSTSLATLLKGDALPWPDRTLVFLWGDEFRQTEMWLEDTERTPVAGISSDMTGQSKETGAIALLERHPDPGAQTVLPPDEHTPWGAFEVEDHWVEPNGLAIIARCAMADVAVAAGGWTTADHPWEGGSDHDVYIKMGVPAVLFWHFTDFTYHTNLDRMEFVDPEEIRRTGTALLATAMAVAGAQPGDLDRYLQTLKREEAVRVDAADAVDRLDAVEAWQNWCYGARMWLRTLCLGAEAAPPPPSKPADER